MGSPYPKAGDEDIKVIWRVSGAVEVVGHCLVEGVLDYAALGDHDGRADGGVNEIGSDRGGDYEGDEELESIAV